MCSASFMNLLSHGERIQVAIKIFICNLSNKLNTLFDYMINIVSLFPISWKTFFRLHNLALKMNFE